ENGNRTGKTGQAYTYDKYDRLTDITVNGDTVTWRYDYTGRRIAKLVDTGGTSPAITFYYSPYMEGSGGWITKYVFADGRLIAGRRDQSSTYAASDPGPIVVARTSLQRPVLKLVLRRDTQFGAGCAVLAIGSVFLLLPGRRKRVVGITVRHGHVLMITFAFTVG